MPLLQWTAVTDLQTLIKLCLGVATDFQQQKIDGIEQGLLSTIQTELLKLRGITDRESCLLPIAVVTSVTRVLGSILKSSILPPTTNSIRDLLAATAYALIIALEL